MAEQKKKSLVSTAIFMVLLAVVLIGVFFKITSSKGKEKVEPNVVISEADQLLARDLVDNYPQTARETLKLYCRIVKCLFSEELDADHMEGLIDMLRALYADDLLQINPIEDMVKNTLDDIEAYRKSGKSMYSYTIDASSKINYINDKLGSRAIINMYFTSKIKSGFERSYQEFVLVEDGQGRWKILGWRDTVWETP